MKGNVIKRGLFSSIGKEYWLAERVKESWQGLPLFTAYEVDKIIKNPKQYDPDTLSVIWNKRLTDSRFDFLKPEHKEPEQKAPPTLYRDQKQFSCSHCGQSGVVDAVAPDGYKAIFRCSCEWLGPNFKFSQPLSVWIPEHFPQFKPKYWDIKAEGVPVKVMHKVIDNGLQPFPF